MTTRDFIEYLLVICGIVGVIWGAIVAGLAISLVVAVALAVALGFAAWKVGLKTSTVDIADIPESKRAPFLAVARFYAGFHSGIIFGLPLVVILIAASGFFWTKAPGHIAREASAVYIREVTNENGRPDVHYVAATPRQIIRLPKTDSVVLVEVQHEMKDGTVVKGIDLQSIFQRIMGGIGMFSVSAWVLIIVVFLTGFTVLVADRLAVVRALPAPGPE